MVAKVFDERVGPVWILGPLDVGGTFLLSRSGSAAINNNLRLCFGTTFSRGHASGGRLDIFFSRSKLAVCT